MLTAIETTGTIEANGRIIIDETFSVTAPTSVRVIVLFPESEDLSETEWMKAASDNQAFDFLNDPEEDIYTSTDGNPIDA
ncbi:MAG: hypothetical protein WKF92_12680 [Pyrinomonadaceae bacterium]